MRIAIITTDSFFSFLLVSDLVARRCKDIVSIVITPSRIKGRGTAGTVWQVLKRTGWSNLIYKVAAGLAVSVAEAMHKAGLVRHCVTPGNLAREHGIPVYQSRDCNDEATLNHLRRLNIDILLSINVYQRIQERLLLLPRIAAVNNHFGLLPKYRGMAPYIWAMASGESEIGLSVHRMVLDFDAGRLLRQERMPLCAGDSAMGVYIRGCMIARTMISEAMAVLEVDPNAGFEQKGEGSYFSMPTRSCIANLKRRGYSLWRFGDLAAVLRGPGVSDVPAGPGIAGARSADM